MRVCCFVHASLDSVWEHSSYEQVTVWLALVKWGAMSLRFIQWNALSFV